MICRAAIVFLIISLCLDSSLRAQTTYSGTDYADAFLATGSPDNPEGTDLTGLNFGGAGTLVVAPATSIKGEFQSVLKFNLSNAVALFNTNYGAGNWLITAISIELTSNYGTAGVQPNNSIFPVISGGQFVIELFSNDNWVEGTGRPNLPTTDGVTYDSLPSLLSGTNTIIATNTYLPPGNNVPVIYSLPLNPNLVASITAGGDVSLLLYAADDQIGYLFNSYSFGHGNEPLINVTAMVNLVPLRIMSGYFTNGVFHLSGIGGANTQYQVQANSNLATTNWQTIGVATADNAGVIQFDDTTSNQPQRFYRLSH
ncbi:MAG TPA: hypothetical protein VNX46_17020 [Candidatus Acidoferrum sp.]|nr:hypothetical protein [Candidatus Acidoferrum sp.]